MDRYCPALAMTRSDEGFDDAGSSRHFYPAQAMAGDYLRTAAGLVPTGFIFATVPVSVVAGAFLGAFAAVFAVFGLRTMLRHGTSIEMTAEELHARGPFRATIRWSELDRLKLSYYSTRRDRRSGWMQLELGAGRTRVGLDSRIEGFDRVVRRAAAAAHERGLDLSESTVANLNSLGLLGHDFASRQ
jgi:hypothetical protein